MQSRFIALLFCTFLFGSSVAIAQTAPDPDGETPDELATQQDPVRPGSASMSPEEREAMRERMQSMSPEEREAHRAAMRERMQSMSPEEREAHRNAMRERMQSMSPEFIALDVRDALSALGELTGETTPDDILESLFRDLCIGK